MNLAFFIARRTAQHTPDNKPGVMERIAVISVALSVAVMILAMAVIMGFKYEVARKVTAFAAHAVVTDVRGVGTLDSEPVRRSARTEGLIRSTRGFASMAPYAVKGGIVRTADAVGEVMLKGVDTAYDWSAFRGWLVDGDLPRVGDSIRTKDILLSRSLADRLMLGVGDRVEMLFVEAGDTPRRDRFKVAGIYSSGMDEMDNTVILTDLRNVQRLSDWAPDEISGYEVFTDDLAGADDFARRLGHTLLYDEDDATANLAVTSVTELYASIFDWLKAHDVNAAVIIVIMLVVAFFNMTSALLILVLERTRMIGLLKAFGMRNGQLRQVFLWRASFITLRGLAVICADLDGKRQTFLLEAEHVAPHRVPLDLTVASVDRFTMAHQTCTFRELLDGDATTEQLVVTFLAMLELAKRGSLTLSQDEIFGTICINRVEGAEAYVPGEGPELTE